MYSVFDLETSYRNSYGRAGNPFDPENKLVLTGWRHKDGVVASSEEIYDMPFPDKLLVGQNIKFDLLWLLKERFDDTVAWLMKGGRIWDTALAEYKMSGQQWLYPKLDDLAVKYGGTLKDDRIKVMWEGGIKTEDIPRDMLTDYLYHDVLNTEIVFLGQMKKLANTKYLRIINEHMGYLLLTTFDEFFGMKVDYEQGIKTRKDLEKRKQELLLKIDALLPSLGVDNEERRSVFNLDSNEHLSSLLYGGDVRYKGRVQLRDEAGELIRFKSGANKGEIKSRIEECTFKLPGIGLEKTEELRNEKEDVYKADREALKSVKDVPIVKHILAYKKIQKLLTTYVSDQGHSVLALVNPDGCVHGALKHVATRTGRLASSSPNQQNIEKKSDLKSLFISRFEGGKILQADWSQLEICILAMLSQDKNMQADIKNNIDFHCKKLAFIENMDYAYVYNKCKVEEDQVWKLKRDKAKGVTYQRSYGASSWAISNKTNMPIEDVETLIAAEDKMYPSVQVYQDVVKRKIDINSKPAKALALNRKRTKVGYYISSLGSIFTFNQNVYPHEYKNEKLPCYTLLSTKKTKPFPKDKLPAFLLDEPKFGSKEFNKWIKQEPTYFNTQQKNYPIQGTAADVVAIGGACLIRALLPYIKFICPINTVHDSYMFDVHPQYISRAETIVAKALQHVNTILRRDFKLEFDFDYKADIKIGNNWKECS